MQGTTTLIITTFFLRVFGYGSMDLVVFALTICALAILIFCLFSVVISGLIMQRKLHKHFNQVSFSYEKICFEAEYPNETGLALASLNFLPLVQLDWKIVYPDHLETRLRTASKKMLLEEIIPDKRCKTKYVTREFKVSDILGFCRYSWLQKQTAEFMVLPRINTLKTVPLLRSLNSEDGIPSPAGNPEGDRMEIRPYAPGDSIRNVMWKVYARNRQLNVRLPEKSVFQDTKTMAYLLSSPNDEAAAAIARMALEQGALGDDWIFGADGSEAPCQDLTLAIEALAQSRSIKHSYGYGLDNFLKISSSHSEGHCIVFAAAERAPWLYRLKTTIRSSSNRFSLVLGTDGLGETTKENLWQNMFFRYPESATSHQRENSSRDTTRKLLTELAQIVESVIIIDRKSGLSFDNQLRKV